MWPGIKSWWRARVSGNNSQKYMGSNKFTKYEIEDIEFFLPKIEDSFNINFEPEELIGIKTFGELCDHIKNKIKLEESNTCTSQQAFYKLRDSLSAILNIEKEKLVRNSSLIYLFPRKSRISKIKELEKHLGFKLLILRPHYLITGFLLLLLITSLVTLLFNWKISLIGFPLSITGFWIANKTSNHFTVENIGQVAQKMSRDNYLKSRRNSKTFNKKEIEKILIDIFSEELGMSTSELTREKRFV